MSSDKNYYKPIEGDNYGVELSFEKDLEEAIKKAKSENKPIILTGARFSGKTTALKKAISKGGINKDQVHVIEIPKGQIVDENKKKELKETIKNLVNSGRLVIIEGTEYEIEYILSDENYKEGIDYIKVKASIKKKEAEKIYMYYAKEYLKKLGNKTIISEEELIKKGKHFLEMAYYEKEGLFMSRYLTWLIERHSDKDERILKLIKKEEREKERLVLGSFGAVDLASNVLNLLSYSVPYLGRRLQFILAHTLNPLGIGLSLYFLASIFYGRGKDESMAKLFEILKVWNEIHPEKKEALCYKLDKEYKLPPGTSYTVLSLWLSKDNIERLKKVLDDDFLNKLEETVDVIPGLKLTIKEQQRILEDHEVRFKKINEKIRKILKKMKELEKKQYTTGSTRIKSEKDLAEEFENIYSLSENQKTIVGLGETDADRKIKEMVENIIKNASANLVLITGDPGVGKSTILFLVGDCLLDQKKKVFYITDPNIFNFVGFSEFLKDSYAILDVDSREAAEKIAERLLNITDKTHPSRIIIAVRTAYLKDYIPKLKEKLNIYEFPLNYSQDILKEVAIRESEIRNITLAEDEINEIAKRSNGISLYISTAIKKIENSIREGGKFEKKMLDELPEGIEAMILKILDEEIEKEKLLLLLYYLVSHYPNFPKELISSAETLFNILRPTYIDEIADDGTYTLHSWYKDITDWIFKGEFNKLDFGEEEIDKDEADEKSKKVQEFREKVEKLQTNPFLINNPITRNYINIIKETLGKKEKVLKGLKTEIEDFIDFYSLGSIVSLTSLADLMMLSLIFRAVGTKLREKESEKGFIISKKRIDPRKLNEESYLFYAKLIGFLLHTYSKDIKEVNINQRPFYALTVLYISRLLNDKLAKRVDEEFLGDKEPSLTLEDIAKYYPYSEDRPIRYYIPVLVTLLEKIGYFKPQTDLEKGLLLLCKGKFDEAIEWFDKAISSDKNNPKYHFYKGKALGLLKRFDEAIREFNEAIELDQNKPDYHIDKAIMLSFLKKYNEAIEEFDKAEKLVNEEDDPRIHYYKGITLSHMKKTDKAIEEFDIAIKLDKEDPEYHIKKGIALRQLGEFNKAKKEYGNAIKEFDEAIKEFDIAIKLDPINPQAHYNKGLALLGKGGYDNAIEEFDIAIKLKPHDPRYHYKKGFAHRQSSVKLRQLGEFDEAIKTLGKAIKEFDEAIRLDPNNPNYHFEKSTALNQLAYFKVSKGDVEEAKKYYEESRNEIDKALFRNPNNPRYLFTMGITLKGLSMNEEAIKFIEKALNKWPGDPDFLIVYATLKADLGSPEEGINKVKEAVKTEKTKMDKLCEKVDIELRRNPVEKEKKVLSEIKNEICAKEGNKK